MYPCQILAVDKFQRGNFIFSDEINRSFKELLKVVLSLVTTSLLNFSLFVHLQWSLLNTYYSGDFLMKLTIFIISWIVPFMAFTPGIAVASHVISCHTIKCLTLIQEKFNKSLEIGK